MNAKHGINFVYQLFNKNGIAKKWEMIQTKYELDNSFCKKMGNYSN